MAPVRFFADGKNSFSPYHIAPWWSEDLMAGQGDNDVPVLSTMRGDFFCMPFGGDNELGEENHTPHGETATGAWALVQHGSHHIAGQEGIAAQFSLDLKVRSGKATKTITTIAGSNAIYIEHVLEGLHGAMPLGHHATLGPENGSFDIVHSPLAFAEVMDLGSNESEKHSLTPRSRFESISCISGQDGHDRNRSFFPHDENVTDIVALISRDFKAADAPAWTMAVYRDQPMAWFTLKNPKQLPSTVLWMENRGRHQSPWSGRNCCIGIEDTCGHIAHGLTSSVAENSLNRDGVPTAITFDPSAPTAIRSIQGAIILPDSHGGIVDVHFKSGELILVCKNGSQAKAAVHWEYLMEV